MKRLLISLIAISFLVSCGNRQPTVDKVLQDGVEVILNHAEPYRVPGEPSVLSLEREFVIDAEDPSWNPVTITGSHNWTDRSLRNDAAANSS